MNWSDVKSARYQLKEGVSALTNSYFPPPVTEVEIAPHLFAELHTPLTLDSAATPLTELKHMIYLHGGAYIAGKL